MIEINVYQRPALRFCYPLLTHAIETVSQIHWRDAVTQAG
jgi:hypothetical protein